MISTQRRFPPCADSDSGQVKRNRSEVIIFGVDITSREIIVRVQSSRDYNYFASYLLKEFICYVSRSPYDLWSLPDSTGIPISLRDILSNWW